MSVVNSGCQNEFNYDPKEYLNCNFREYNESVASRWKRLKKFFEKSGKFSKTEGNIDIKISSLVVFMLFRVDDNKFDRLEKMVHLRDEGGIVKYVDREHIPLIYNLLSEKLSSSDSISGTDSRDEQTPPSDKSEDKIASSSEGLAKPKRRKKVSRSLNDGNDLSSFIFTPKREESVEELPYMREQKGAKKFPITTNRFVLSEEAQGNLKGERRDAEHFVDLKHLNEAMGKILRKNIFPGQRIAPTYQVSPDKFLRVVVDKYRDNLAVITCYYMSRSKLVTEGGGPKNEVQTNHKIEQLPKLNGTPAIEYIKASHC